MYADRLKGLVEDLKQGQMFGEISCLYGCKRTATIIAKQYGSCAKIKAKQFQEMMVEYTEWRKYLEESIISYYTDDVKIFLTSVLRRIHYLKELPDRILNHIAFLMISMQLKNDEQLFSYHTSFANDLEREQIENDEFADDRLFIIFDGIVKVEAQIDGNDFISIDYLAKGCVLRPYHCLVNRANTVKYTVIDNCLVYYLKLETLALLSVDYPELKQALRPIIEQ